MKNLAIIPARSGSKRIKNKNIKSFHGKPILAYSIELALKSNLFEEVMVSTDSEEIAQIAIAFGAKVPFMRSMKNSDDYATISNVVEETIFQYENGNKHFDNFCCIFPTAPLISEEVFHQAYSLLIKEEFFSVFPVVSFSFPIWRSLKVVNNKASMIWPENLNARSQDLEKAYHDVGQFYWMNVNRFKEEKRIFSSNSGVIELSGTEVQDIDNEDDWLLAELKYELLRRKKFGNT